MFASGDHSRDAAKLLGDYGSVDSDTNANVDVAIDTNERSPHRHQKHHHPHHASLSSFDAPEIYRHGHPHPHYHHSETESATTSSDEPLDEGFVLFGITCPSLRRVALELSLYVNLIITLAKLVAYVQTLSLSVLAALLDSILDVVSQIILNYTEKHSSLQRSSAFYPAGASRLEPIGVLTCAALMGMASFEVLKQSFTALVYHGSHDNDLAPTVGAFVSMLVIVVVKLLLLVLCHRAANKRVTYKGGNTAIGTAAAAIGDGAVITTTTMASKAVVQMADPTLEALSLDHWNDALSNLVAAVALLFTLRSPKFWFLDPLGAILISIYIIYSWYSTGFEQIQHLTGKAAPEDFIDEIMEIAKTFDERMEVDSLKAYHFGPKFLVELEMVMPKNTLLFESHDLGMELQYEIEGLPEVERCFVHVDYETRPYDEHVVSKVPELREKYRPGSNVRLRSTQSV